MRALDLFMEKGVQEKVFSGAMAWASLKGKVVYEKAVGHDGSSLKNPISAESFFDLASLTKVLATTLVAMRLVESGVISLETPLCEMLPEWKNHPYGREIRLFHLLQHTSGLPAFLNFYETLSAFPLENRVQERRKLLLEIPLLQRPGLETLYSDLGFILLKEAFVEITEKPFEKLFSESLPKDFSEKERLFFPSVRNEAGVLLPFVTTSFSVFRNHRLYGEVHDENAAVMGGVDGHAGLFGTASSVGSFAEILLQAWHGRSSFFSPDILGQFIFWPKDGKRPLGFDRPSGETPSSGSFFSAESIGHLGFTGTSLWMDLPRDFCVVLLTNRVCYGDDNWKIRDFRPGFHNLLMKTLGLVKA